MTEHADITQLVEDATVGGEEAARKLMPLVYNELRALAARYLSNESPGHTLQATALVNEAFLKLISQNRISYEGRMHFFAIAATLMQRILVDHARRKMRRKRGGGLVRIELMDDLPARDTFEETILDVHDAIGKLEKLDPRQAQIVQLRFFGGMKMEEIATVLKVSKRTVEDDWTMVRAWLMRELGDRDDD